MIKVVGLPDSEEFYNLTQLAEVTIAAKRLSTTNVKEITEYLNNNKVGETIASRFEQQIFKVENEIPLKCFENNSDLAESEYMNKQCSQLFGNNFLLKSETSDEDGSSYSHKLFDRKKIRRSTITESQKCDEYSWSSSFSNTNSISSNSGDELIAENSSSMKISSCSESSDSGEHVCQDCGKKYSTSSNLARHRQTHRSIEDKKARRCPQCPKVYVSIPAFSMHMRTHNLGCKCDICGKCFSRPWLLQGHKRTHTGEKPFKCNICPKAFADKSNLRAHVQTHSEIKPHTCSKCGKAFALKSYLYKHEDSSCIKSRKQQHGLQRNEHSRKSYSKKALQQLSLDLIPQIESVNSYQQDFIMDKEQIKNSLVSKLLRKNDVSEKIPAYQTNVGTLLQNTSFQDFLSNDTLQDQPVDFSTTKSAYKILNNLTSGVMV